MLIFHRLHLQSLHLVPWFPIQDQLCLPCGSSEEFPTARIGECYDPMSIPYHFPYYKYCILISHDITIALRSYWADYVLHVDIHSTKSFILGLIIGGHIILRQIPDEIWSLERCVAMAWLGQAVGHRTLDISWDQGTGQGIIMYYSLNVLIQMTNLFADVLMNSWSFHIIFLWTWVLRTFFRTPILRLAEYNLIASTGRWIGAASSCWPTSAVSWHKTCYFLMESLACIE